MRLGILFRLPVCADFCATASGRLQVQGRGGGGGGARSPQGLHCHHWVGPGRWAGPGGGCPGSLFGLLWVGLQVFLGCLAGVERRLSKCSLSGSTAPFLGFWLERPGFGWGRFACTYWHFRAASFSSPKSGVNETEGTRRKLTAVWAL